MSEFLSPYPPQRKGRKSELLVRDLVIQEVTETGTKVCYKCKIEKHLTHFGNHKRKKDGKRGCCKLCEKIERKEYLSTPGGKEREIYNNRKWYAEKRDANLIKAKKWHEENKEHRVKYARNHLLKKYGLKEDQYNNMLHEQNGKCKICGADKADRIKEVFYIDHCHSTGKVRGVTMWKV